MPRHPGRADDGDGGVDDPASSTEPARLRPKRVDSLNQWGGFNSGRVTRANFRMTSVEFLYDENQKNIHKEASKSTFS